MSKALLLVDIQNDFSPRGALPVPDGDAVVPVINQLIPLLSMLLQPKTGTLPNTPVLPLFRENPRRSHRAQWYSSGNVAGALYPKYARRRVY